VTHHHRYRSDISDWWCDDCDTVTDFCTELGGPGKPEDGSIDIVQQDLDDDADEGGIPAEAQADGHQYVMSPMGSYCPRCSDIASEREGRRITELDCLFDLDK
jgi:hypothetical protein